jgi:hypothetical protein
MVFILVFILAGSTEHQRRDILRRDFKLNGEMVAISIK